MPGPPEKRSAQCIAKLKFDGEKNHLVIDFAAQSPDQRLAESFIL